MTKIAVLVLLAVHQAACSSSPYRVMTKGEPLESRYVSYQAPDSDWKISKNSDPSSWSSGISSQQKGASYTIQIANYPLSDADNLQYFNKDAEYVQTSKDEDMKIGSIEKEQGIGYIRNWTSYAMGLKCAEGVFSRSQGGLMTPISNKNYSLLCGYYDRTEGMRLLSIRYRYNYAGGTVRHESDKNTPQEELLTLDQAELGLKQAVKKIVATLKIKNVDWERMQREGLVYVGKEYEISPY